MSVQRFTILLDEDDLTCVQARCPEALSGSVMAFDPDLHVALQNRNIRHITPWDIVNRCQWDALCRFDDDVWKFWRRHALAEYDRINLLEIAAYRHMTCFSRLAWGAFVISQSFEKLRPREVVVFEEPVGHGLDQPAGYRKMPLLFALLRGMAEQAGIGVTVLSRDGVSAVPGFTDHVATAPKRSLPRICPRDYLEGRPYLLMNASGPDVARQLPLIEALRRETDVPIVQLYKAADETTLCAARAVGHYLWHESQVVWDDQPPDVQTLSERAREAFELACRDADRSLHGIFRNPYMGIHFDFIFGEYLKKMAWHVRTWTRFFEKYRPGMLLTSYHAPILDVAQRLGIPCLGLPHGSLMIGNERWFRSLPSVTIGAISALHRDRLVASGIRPERIRVTGTPWTDPLIRRAHARAKSETKSEAGDDVRALRDQLGISSGGPVVLIGTGNLGMPAKATDIPYVDWADAVRCFERLGDLAAGRPEWTFVLKCHPHFDHPPLYERVNRRLPRACRITIIADEPLDRLMRLADVAVFHNVLTSGLLEASLTRKPVYLLSPSMIGYDAVRWATHDWPHVASVDELEEELAALFTNPEAYERRASQTQEALRVYFSGEPTPSIPRCLNLIRMVMAEKLQTAGHGGS